MSEGIVQRRGVPQAEAIAIRFGQETLGSDVTLPGTINPVAKVARLDIPSIGGTSLGALAANRSMLQLFNPSGSGTDVFLQRVWMAAGVATTARITTHDIPLTTNVSSLLSMVRREGSNQFAPVAQVRSVQGAAVGAVCGLLPIQANLFNQLDFSFGDGQHFDGFVLEPGRGFMLDPGADDRSITATFMWRERALG